MARSKTPSSGENDWDGVLDDGVNVETGTSTGSMIGASASQKLALWGQTPVVQQSGTGSTAGFTQGGVGQNVLNVSTFTGGLGTRAYTIDDIVRHLKTVGILKRT